MIKIKPQLGIINQYENHLLFIKISLFIWLREKLDITSTINLT